MNILALDLGTTTGFAYRSHGAIVTGTWSLKPGRFEGGGMRFVKFKKHLLGLCGQNISARHLSVYFEAVHAHKGCDAAHIYGGFMATLTEWCEINGVPYLGVPVGTIKKHATGKGNAGKPAMIAAARARGFDPTDDNEADAIALLNYVLEHTCILDHDDMRLDG